MNIKKAMYEQKLFRMGRQLIDRLQSDYHQAYFVGGCVRDLLLNRKLHDVDICTSATPQEILSIFPRTIPTGIKHGTITVLLDHVPFEVTTFRHEGEYVAARHPKSVTYIRSLKGDLARRDFTINAMALDRDGQLFDFFNGREHLEQHLIQTVGEAEQRFEEDALRMIRAVRFAAELNFELSAECQQAIENQRQLLNQISIERLSGEFHKMLKGAFVDRGLAYFHQFTLAQLRPFSLISNAFEQLKRYTLSPLTYWERWLFLCTLTPCADLNWKRFIMLSALTRQEKKRLISQVETFVGLRHVLESGALQSEDLLRIGCEAGVQLLRVNQWRELGRIDHTETQKLKRRWERFPITNQRALALNGRDLIHYYQRAPGAWIKKALQLAFHAVANREVQNETKRILQYLDEQLECEAHE